MLGEQRGYQLETAEPLLCSRGGDVERQMLLQFSQVIPLGCRRNRPVIGDLRRVAKIRITISNQRSVSSILLSQQLHHASASISPRAVGSDQRDDL